LASQLKQPKAVREMPFAVLAKCSYCPVYRPKTVEHMQPNAQNHSRTITSGCPVRQLIGQLSGIGDSFVVH
jgi:hypothetical protein